MVDCNLTGYSVKAKKYTQNKFRVNTITFREKKPNFFYRGEYKLQKSEKLNYFSSMIANDLPILV
jgi:hypothetical protein